MSENTSEAGSETLQRNKAALEAWWAALTHPGAGSEDALYEAAIAPMAGEGFVAHVCSPFNDLDAAGFVEQFWLPFRAAFPDVARRADIQFGGQFNGGAWVCSTGYFDGTFAGDWLGIPATGMAAGMRYGEFWRFEAGKLVEGVLLLDIPDVIHQAGYEVLPGYGGQAGRAPAPMTGDGIVPSPQDEELTARSLQLVEDMIYKGLLAYDGEHLSSMNMAAYWLPGMRWYGPHPIGRCDSLREFEDFHQRPFLQSFPDRRGGNHKARLAEGAYVASTGWPSIRATFAADYLGVPATKEQITMRVMDWWRAEPTAEGDQLAENWVFIDLIDFCLQVGVDVFARLREQVAAQGK